MLIACCRITASSNECFSVFSFVLPCLSPRRAGKLYKRKSALSENKDSYRLFSFRSLLPTHFSPFVARVFSCVSTCRGRGSRMKANTSVSTKRSTIRSRKHVYGLPPDKRMTAHIKIRKKLSTPVTQYLLKKLIFRLYFVEQHGALHLQRSPTRLSFVSCHDGWAFRGGGDTIVQLLRT